ncbi:MAG: FAD-binding oxidoreductase [Pseudomonadota bacterium]
MSEIARSPSPNVLNALRAVTGPKGVFEGDAAAPFLSERRGRWAGEAGLILAPATTEEVAKIVALCAEARVAITPQGGNTGLVGGQMPIGGEILLSLKRMARIREIDPLNNTMTVDAGVVLAAAQDAARDAGRFFPLSIGSEGTCQIGGVLSTNAGGVNVLRYGSARQQVLGLEAVLPNGSVWNGLRKLRKDNTGYDLKQLLVGAEGTLGIITGAVLKLYPSTVQTTTAFVGVPSADAAVELLSYAQGETGGAASSFELISRQSLDLVVQYIPGARDPLRASHPWYVLAEFSSGAGGALREQTEDMLAGAMEKGMVVDAAIAENEKQAGDFWRMRHSISEAINHVGLGARHDVSVATSAIPAFLERADAAVRELAPGARIVAFGHVGDGNVHYDIAPAEGAAKNALDNLRDDIERAVYDVIAEFSGSISAEHGVGQHKRSAIAAQKSDTEMTAMRAIKSALDPLGIMNPGKVL